MRTFITRHCASASLTALATMALAGMAQAQTAQAQTAPAAAPAQDVAPPQDAADTPPPSAADIVVTGSRITTSGFNAPTPTTVIGEEQIANNAQPNVFNTIAQLPSLQGSTGAATGTFSTSSGQQGLSSFSLRGLGAIRTLTLLDGQRVVGANVTKNAISKDAVADHARVVKALDGAVDFVVVNASCPNVKGGVVDVKAMAALVE